MEEIINEGKYCRFSINIDNVIYIVDTVYNTNILYVKYTSKDGIIRADYDVNNVINNISSPYNFHISTAKEDDVKKGLNVLQQIIDYIKNNLIEI